MISETIQQLQIALHTAHNAMVQQVLLAPKHNPMQETVDRAIAKKDAIGNAVRSMVNAQKRLSKLLNANRCSTYEAAQQLASEVMSDLFKQPMPGKVTLPVWQGHGRMSEVNVTGLERIHVADSGTISGSVQYQANNHSGVCGFVISDGRAYFEESI